MSKYILAQFRFRNGYASSLPITEGNGYLRQGTINAMVTGAGLIVPFKGLGAQLGLVGSKQSFMTDNYYAGLGSGSQTGQGSMFQAINLMFFCGEGAVAVKGIQISDGVDPLQASTNLSYLKRVDGEFTEGTLGTNQFQVGHPRPDSPSIYLKTPPSSGKSPMSAAISVVVWRADSNTGQTSLPSVPSTVLELANGSCIVQFGLPDANGQDVWGIGVPLLGLRDLGNFYQLPIDIGGEVLESTLSYTRAIDKATINLGDTVLTIHGTTPVDKQFTTADIGRRVSIGVGGADLDSWIVSITDAFTAVVHDAALNTVGDVPLTITHAIDGITRAVEISWADTDLFGQELAPYLAFEPPDCLFAGVLRDTFYVEDLEGTILYSVPNSLSFPRSQRIFTEDRATCWISTGNGYHWRIAPQSVGRLYYIGGLQPIQLDILSNNIGCQFVQNACVGYGGNLMLWSGRPTLIGIDGSMNSTFYLIVEQDFDGWEDQTEDEPVVTAYDPIGQYEVWVKGRTAIPRHAPTGNWSSPCDLTPWLESEESIIVGRVVIHERLHLVEKTVSGDLLLKEWNANLGSVMTLQSYYEDTQRALATISQIDTIVQAADRQTSFKMTVIKDFVKEIEMETVDIPSNPHHQVLTSFRPNIRGGQVLGVKVEVSGGGGAPADGRAAVDYITFYGEISETFAQVGTAQQV